MKARIPTTKSEKQEFNEYIKRNFNLYAERIFQCWAMAMNDAGDSSEKVSDTAKKAYKLMTEICEHRISWKDMHDVIKDESALNLCLTISSSIRLIQNECLILFSDTKTAFARLMRV